MEISLTDFTIDNYKRLLNDAFDRYKFITFEKESLQAKTQNNNCLWRHDVDYSVINALKLSEIEKEIGVAATYFFQLSSDYYNVFDHNTSQLIKKIIQHNHKIGLHFYPGLYKIESEDQLIEKLAFEKHILEKLLDMPINVFSFHNPTEAIITNYHKLEYAGMINTYAAEIKDKFAYCSDSNGYWRHKRLEDFLKEGQPNIQVLTHPAWWQSRELYPRERIFNTIYQRAELNQKDYDNLLKSHGRINVAGKSEAIDFLKPILPEKHQFLDYLWNKKEMSTLFVQLWILHEKQINKICKAVFRKAWNIPAKHVNDFFLDKNLRIDGWKLFELVFEQQWKEAIGLNQKKFEEWVSIRNLIVHGKSSFSPNHLEEGCVFMANTIASLAKWSVANSGINYDGLISLNKIGLPTYITADGELIQEIEERKGGSDNFPLDRWEKLKKNYSNSNQK